MNNLNNDLVRGKGSRVEDAMDMFRAIIQHNNLESHKIQDWGDIYLKYLTDPEGWLGIWMLKSDEACAFLLGCRMWDAIYIKDVNCVQAIRPINMAKLDDQYSAYDLESYHAFPLAESKSENIPRSLLFLIANYAFQESLIIMGKEVNIKPVSGFYNTPPEFGDGDVLPFQDHVRLAAFSFNQYVCSLHRNEGINVGLSKEIKF
jgi:hypothetical protein